VLECFSSTAFVGGVSIEPGIPIDKPTRGCVADIGNTALLCASTERGRPLLLLELALPRGTHKTRVAVSSGSGRSVWMPLEMPRFGWSAHSAAPTNSDDRPCATFCSARPVGENADVAQATLYRRSAVRYARRVRNQDTWLILPVVICLSQRLSHACLSINKSIR
jgi:hypothetical protein